MKANDNIMKSFFKEKGGYAIGLLLIFSIIFLILEVYNGRFWQSDFTVYYKSAIRLLNGENMFRIAEDGHYVFKYSPVSALLFIPFTALPLSISKYIYWFVLTGIVITNFYLATLLAYKLDNNKGRNINKIILLGSLVMVVHFQRELHLGQVNQILLLLYLLIAINLQRNKPILVGALLSLSIFIKPFGLIFIPYLIVTRKYKELVSVIGAGTLYFFLPLLFFNWEMFLGQNMHWYNELAIELNNKQDLMLGANHTIFSVLARYTGIGYLLTSSTATMIFQLAILTGIAFLILWFIKLGKNKKNSEIAEMALLISLIPLLSFTSHNAFGFASLMVIIILVYFKQLTFVEKTAAITGFVFLGGNYYDIWGGYLSGVINDISLVSIGTLLLMSIIAMKRYQKII